MRGATNSERTEYLGFETSTSLTLKLISSLAISMAVSQEGGSTHGLYSLAHNSFSDSDIHFGTVRGREPRMFLTTPTTILSIGHSIITLTGWAFEDGVTMAWWGMLARPLLST